MSAAVRMIHLPKTMATWPWPRSINPHYEEVKAESDAWFKSFQAFTPDSQRAFDKGDFGRLTGLAYPWARKEHLRTGCDLMNLFFAIDEYTDVEDAAGCREIVDTIMDALNDPHKPRPEGEVLLGEIARQFWALAVQNASSSSQKYFIDSVRAYLEAVISHAADRDNNTIRTVENYFKFASRRDDVGIRPCFTLIGLAMDLPDEVLEHPVIVGLSTCIADIIIIDNDLASYNKEQATGSDLHNILTIVMHHFHCDIDHAILWAAERHRETQKRFLRALSDMPSWGPEHDAQVSEYVLGLANWARANDCWNFEGGRYFGDKGLEFQKTRCVPLLPENVPKKGLHLQDVIVPSVEFSV